MYNMICSDVCWWPGERRLQLFMQIRRIRHFVKAESKLCLNNRIGLLCVLDVGVCCRSYELCNSRNSLLDQTDPTSL